MSKQVKITPRSSTTNSIAKLPSGAAPAAADSDIEEDEELELSVLDETDDESGATEASASDADDSGSESAGGAEDNDENDTDTEDGGDGGEGDGDGEGEEGGGGGAVASAVKQKKASKKRGATKKNIEDDLTLLGVPHGLTFDDDDDDDDDGNDSDEPDNAEYFQKLKSSVRETFVQTYHPETFSHNYDEIQTLSRVVRNSAGVIVDDLHKTTPIMTKYEKTRILGQRAKQINEGAPPFIKIDSTVIDGYLIAMKELEQKKTPFIIRRPLPNGGSEYWRVQDLEIL